RASRERRRAGNVVPNRSRATVDRLRTRWRPDRRRPASAGLVEIRGRPVVASRTLEGAAAIRNDGEADVIQGMPGHIATPRSLKRRRGAPKCPGYFPCHFTRKSFTDCGLIERIDSNSPVFWL